MQVIFTFFLLLSAMAVCGQTTCEKYNRAVKSGDDFMKVQKYKEAIVEYQTAQIAARECDNNPEGLTERFKRVFDALTEQKEEADANRVIAERASVLAKERLLKEQKETKRAELLKNLALSQTFANAAYIFCEKDPTIAMSFAFSSLKMHSNKMAQLALLKAFNINSWFYKRFWENLKGADLSQSGDLIAMIDEKNNISVENLKTGRILSLPWHGDKIRFLNNDNLLVWTPLKPDKKVGELIIISKEGKVISHQNLKFLNLVLDEKGTIIVPVIQEKRIEIYRINPANGKMTSVVAPQSFTNLSFFYNASSLFTILCEGTPGEIWITTSSPTGIVVTMPQKKNITSIDIRGMTAAFYLRSTVKGESDALGILNLDGVNSGRKITLYPLDIEKGEKSKGTVKFLDNNIVLASSENGNSKIFHLRTKASFNIPGFMACDQIITLPKDSCFIAGRRSGELTMYDFQGVPIGCMQGCESSAGATQAFFKLSMDTTREQLLTVSRNDVRIWQRPKYSLKFKRSLPGKEIFLPNELSYFKSFYQADTLEEVIIEDDPLSSIPINNLGEVFLKFRLGGHTDVFKTNLQKEVEDVISMKQENDYIYGLDTDRQYKRIFVTDPDVIYKLIKKEFDEHRLILINETLKSRWVELPDIE